MASEDRPFAPPVPPASPTVAIMPLIAALFVLVVATLGLITIHYVMIQLCKSGPTTTSTEWLEDIEEGTGNGSDVGVDSKTLNSIPIHAYSKMKHDESGRIQQGECAVCLGEFEEREAVRKLPNCGHIFHTHCVDLWFLSQSNCPLCRAPVVDSEVARGEGSGNGIGRCP